MTDKSKKDKKGRFADTLNLPRTEFPIRPNAKQDDPAMIIRWEDDGLYDAIQTHNEGKEPFILHDGPPYANGNIHLGTAFNKILKDIVTKAHRMAGNFTPITPGWDCHGLPIELKVTKEHPNLPPEQLKKACRAFAQKWINTQREQFKRLGVVMDWDHPYLTMAPQYEAAILRAFGTFVADGYIARKNKTVPWCGSCQTTLATVEIEYKDRKDPSIYVLFPLAAEAIEKVFPALKGKDVNLLIWTTTPWTLPLNRAVLLRPNTQYVVCLANDTYYIVAKELSQKLADLFEMKPEIVAEFQSNVLKDSNAKAHHPFVKNLTVPVLLDDSVLLGDGTACVHSAPGCGPEDYEVGIKNNLEIFSPLSPDGKYTHRIEPQELEGMPVADGQIWVLKTLKANNRLFFKNNIRHSYPHCWRCRNGLMFRATKQWFCDLSRGNLKEKALKAIELINTIPAKSKNRLHATVEGRLEWCLSRQRIWGTPIPALFCTKCDYTYQTQGLIEKVAQGVEKQGIEYWDIVSISDLLPSDFVCPVCKNDTFKKESDILDVWFDSGVSHYAVLKPRGEFPADMYLEGKDQHRGWFQSSLLTALVLEGQAPTKTIVTHGYTVDEKGHKMSKSLGNVVSPGELIEKLGTDGLRLWVTSVDAAGDPAVSQDLLKNVQQVFSKVRNTCRFLLSNLYDFDFGHDAIAIDDMLPIDRYALTQLIQVSEKCKAEYKAVDFTAIFHRLADYTSVELSSLYLDIIKDRLYCDAADGLSRRSAQTVCWYVLDTLTRLIAPIFSFTAEQLSDFYQKNKTVSIHLQSFSDLSGMASVLDKTEESVTSVTEGLDTVHDSSIAQKQWEFLRKLRSAILKGIEQLRSTGDIKHSLEADVKLFIENPDLLRYMRAELENGQHDIGEFFRQYLIVSEFLLTDSRGTLQATEIPGVYVSVTKAQGDKCPRCWKWHNNQQVDLLCGRCAQVVNS